MVVPDGAPFRYPGWEAEGAGQAREPGGGVLEEEWLSGHWPCSREEGKHQRLLGSALVYLWGATAPPLPITQVCSPPF